MANITFDEIAKSVINRTIDNDFIRVMIDTISKKLTIETTLTTHYSDDTTALKQIHLVLRDKDFTVAMTALFPTKPWDNPSVDFKAAIIALLKDNKEKLT